MSRVFSNISDKTRTREFYTISLLARRFNCARSPYRCGRTGFINQSPLGNGKEQHGFYQHFQRRGFDPGTVQRKDKGHETGGFVHWRICGKGKDDKQKKDIESLNQQIAEKDETIANLEKAKGDADSMQKELDRYKQAEADREKAEKEAQMDAILTQTAESALEGREFVND